MGNKTIIDNRKNGSVGDFLKDVIQEDSDLSVVSAYFTIFAYYGLKEQLDSIKSLKFLFGEPAFIDPENLENKTYSVGDDGLIPDASEKIHQKNLAMTCANWLKEKAEIKSIMKPNFLHGKMYYVDKEAKGYPKAISGSSNFTTSGLGLKNAGNNVELNLVVDSDNQKNELKTWFDEIWNDQTGLVQDVKEEVLKYLTTLYKENEPELVYFKTLYNIFKGYLDDQKDMKLFDETAFKDTKVWNDLYDFQKDGVKGAINKLQKHNGCIIADAVGLGKTYEALAIIKYYELRNQRVLVICPKKLSDNWTVYQAVKNSKLNTLAADRLQYNVLYHTDMGRLEGESGADRIKFREFKWSAYDLVVIDESHNFKGNPMDKTKSNGEMRMNRAKWLMEKVIKEGGRTKVLMLSATPVNNCLKDLRNQINFITEERQDALQETTGISNIANTLEVAQRQFTEWSDTEKNPHRSSQQLLERLDSSFFKLLDELTIARSRRHVKKFYRTDDVGKFPERLIPKSVTSKIDNKDCFPNYADIEAQISKYKLAIFSPSVYLKPEMKAIYASKFESSVAAFIQEDRESSLIGMMKVNYLKRLESSIYSFALSIKRTIDKINELEDKIKSFKRMKAENASTDQFDVEDGFEYDEDGELLGLSDDNGFSVGKKIKIRLEDLNLDEWERDLQSDKSALASLYNNAIAVTVDRDAKLEQLKQLIRNKINRPINSGNKKVVVFTAFADTAEYIYNNISKWAKEEFDIESGLVCGEKNVATWGSCEFNMILTNFAPIAKKRKELDNVDTSKELDLLVATDCISEGQNLQDGDYLVNYDIHWNPVRIIQRFGRIDRLGSKNNCIQLVNFWPTEDLDEYINLKNRVESRMTLVDLTGATSENPLETQLAAADSAYRDEQLKRLKEEVVDLEDMNNSISLTDFTLDDFRIDLVNFLKDNEEKFKKIPDGIYAVVPSPENTECPHNKNFEQNVKDVIKPGVIYCLKHKNAADECEIVNPLNPYYLVYIQDDGVVKYNYTNAKSILEIYRLLCSGETAPYEKLCELFNQDICDGANMSKYTRLLEDSVAKIAESFKARSNSKLTNSRSAILLSQNRRINSVRDFELISWLVIK